MTIPEIKIKILEDGKVVAEVHGVDGPTCVEISKFLESLGEVTEDRHTPDYYKPDWQGVIVQR